MALAKRFACDVAEKARNDLDLVKMDESVGVAVFCYV
jgi:hypothetical protein